MTTNEPDWTVHDGRSNSSPEFHAATAVIEDIIRSSAHTLISGRADTVAGTILATLAHRHGLRPGVAAPEPPTDLRDAIAAAIERHEVVWVDHDTGWECGCNEHGDCALMPTRADAVHHIADAVLPTVQAHVAAEVERARAEADKELDEALRERDETEAIADRLAYSIAPQEVIGEHSSGNFPWLNALDLAPKGGWQAAVERARVEGAAEALRLAAKDIAACRAILSLPAAAVVDRILRQRADRIATGGEQRG